MDISSLWRRFALVALAAVSMLGMTASEAERPAGKGEGLQPVAQVDFENGTHLELARIKGRDYAFVNQLGPTSAEGRLLVFDVTIPAKPRRVAELPCGGYQGNIQISHDKKTLLLGLDSPAGTGGCMTPGDMGFVTIDIRQPTKPKAMGRAVMPNGSHSLAAHPTKPFVYNAEGFPDTAGDMQVWSIKDPAKPKLVTTLDTGVHSPHDLSFNRDGSMAATANIVNFHVLDTTEPADPKIVATSQCPGCMHTHEARFTPDGRRLVVNDEYVVAPVCPSGALYFYDLDDAGAPTLSGAYVADDVVANAHGDVAGAGMCTPHVFDVSDDGSRLAASWHQAGIKYLDITNTSGVGFGTKAQMGGPTQLGWYANDGGDAFTAKLHRGPYVYVVDIEFGFQVFKIDAAIP